MHLGCTCPSFQVFANAHLAIPQTPQIIAARCPPWRKDFSSCLSSVSYFIRCSFAVMSGSNLIAGPPASGKGTLCKQLAANHKLFHLSVGDFLRALTNGRLANRADIVASFKAGGTQGLVPGEVLVPLLVKNIREEMDGGESVFLLDGFPRDLEQDSTFKAKMQAEFGVSSRYALCKCYPLTKI